MKIKNNTNDLIAEAWTLIEKSTVYYHGRPIGTVAALEAGSDALNYDLVAPTAIPVPM
ncbi:hypothetical protein KBT16_24325 [Nostoc sp. CCCryo 231-06]|nr:hypothetical protein [Nostoc sp. CCCryo 231-06]